MFDNNSFKFVLYFLVAFFATSFVTPIAIRMAFRLKIIDAPNERKVHKYSKPRVGGVAMFAVYFLLLLSLDLSFSTTKALLVGSVLITFFGFLDDLFGIRAMAKLIFQIMVALITASDNFGFGIKIESVRLLSDFTLELGVFAVPITIIWIVAVMNAVNLIDGLDGLAAGISAIASFTMGICAIIFGQIQIALIFFILLGVILGFLRYNFNPAKLFMGDAGSLFLGYNLAVLSVLAIWNTPRVFVFTIPILLLGIPFYDVLTSIFRRWKNKKPIFSADGNHIHHRIMAIGFSHKQTVIIVYIETLCLAICCATIILINDNKAVLVFMAIVILVHFSYDYLIRVYLEEE